MNTNLTEKEKLALRMAVQLRAAREPINAGMTSTIPARDEYRVVEIHQSWFDLPMRGRVKCPVIPIG